MPVELLLRAGAPLDVFDAAGHTPVHLASASVGGADCLTAIARTVGSEVLDIPDAQGLTPLMHACFRGNEASIKLLLKKKVSAKGKSRVHLSLWKRLPPPG